MEVAVIPTIIGALGTDTKKIDKETERLGNKRTGGDHSNCSSKIGQNTKKCP